MKKDILHSRSAWNLITGIGYQLISTLLGLVLPYLFITSFGSETNGLLSSIGQILAYLSLLEGGISVASMQALYCPIARNNREEISSVLTATTEYFNRTGVLYGVGVLLLAVVYPLVVNSPLPPLTVFALIAIQGAGGVFSYVVQGKYTPLIRADGRLYVTQTINMVFTILRNGLKIVVISLGYSVLAVQIVHCLLSVLQTLIVCAYIRKKYGWLNKQAKPNREALAQKDSLFAQHIAWMLFNHIDVLLLTVVVKDLALVSIYSVYLLVFEAIQNVLDTVCNGLQHKMGRYGQESRQALAVYYAKFERTYLALAFALFGVTYLLVRPFISLYVGGVDDADYLMPWVAELFLIVKVLNAFRLSNRKVIEVVGHFRETKEIIYGEMILNVAVSVCLAPVLGIYGVLLGTVAALLYSVIAHSRYVNCKILSTGMRRTVVHLGRDTALLAVICVIGHELVRMSETYVRLVGQAVVVTIAVCSLFLLLLILEKSVVAGQNDG